MLVLSTKLAITVTILHLIWKLPKTINWTQALLDNIAYPKMAKTASTTMDNFASAMDTCVQLISIWITLVWAIA